MRSTISPYRRHLLAAAALVSGLSHTGDAQVARAPKADAMRRDDARVPSTEQRIDIVTPLAPELAAYGTHPIGVRTITVTDRQRRDVLRMIAGDSSARYDRPLTLEVWYPAAGAPPARLGEYRVIMRDPSVTVSLYGQAQRDAAPRDGDAPYPLLIISHGYPGNRYLLGHLGENLASKGYVVVSIDHTESTYDNAQAFASTLYNRPFDQLFVLQAIAELGAPTSGSFLAGRVDANRTGIIGYSMGGYGVVNVIGGGFRPAAAALPGAPPRSLLLERSADNATYRQSGGDARIKAAVAIGPWGMQLGVWDAAGLAGIRTPTLFVAGSADDVSGYENGTRALFRGAVNADRYLLTFVGAGHNAAAPIPAPAESYAYSASLKSFPFTHYADPMWDTRRMNNILAHFVTAHFDARLKGDSSKLAFLQVVTNGKDGVYAMDRDGKPQPTHSYWKGFKRGTAAGLVLEQERASSPLPSSDDTAIRAVIAEYFTAHARADSSIMRRPFLPTARIEGVRNDSLVSWTVDQYVALFRGTPASDETQRWRRIDTITISGTAATATATLQHGATMFTDYFLLLKLDGRWRIANKVYAGRPTRSVKDY